MSRTLASTTGSATLLTLSLASASPTQAAEPLRIAQQFGITYLLLHVAQDQSLIEKYAAERGVNVDVEWRQLSGGAAVNDALLSNSIDIAGAGIGPLLTIWDRTQGSLNVKGIASLGQFPNFLITNNPAIKSLEDIGENDRIAVPAAGVSVQSRFLQKAVADIFGQDQFDRLEANTVALPHPDATATLISGGTEVNTHFSSAPFQYQALQHEGVHKITDSYEILGGPVSPTVLYATEAFHNDNPDIYRAFLEALAEAKTFIEENPSEAARIYQRVTGTQLDIDFIESIITDDQVSFSLVPHNTFPLAEFLFDINAIRNEPASWQDYFFEDSYSWEGS